MDGAKDADANVSGNMPLYDEPEYGYTGATLSSQIVHIKGIFYRPMQMPTYLVESWIGEKWFTPYGNSVIEGVTKTNETVSIEGNGVLFGYPSDQYYSQYMTTYSPQTFTAYARYHDFYKVKTKDGRDGWVSRHFSQPVLSDSADTDINLTEKTTLYGFSNVQSYIDHLAPQTVHAKQKFQDIWGNTWYNINAWIGDAWIKHNDNGIDSPNKIADKDNYIHVLPQIVAFGSRTVSGRVYIANFPKFEAVNDLNFTIQMIDLNGNLVASGEAFIPEVRVNDEVSFSTVLSPIDPDIQKYTFRISSVQFKIPL